MSPRQAIWLALHWLTITTGLIVLALFGFLTSMGHMGMRTVFPTAPVYGLVTQRLYDPAHLWRHIGLIGLGVLLVAGLPCVRRPSSGAPEGSSRVFGGIALAAAATFGVAFANIFYFTDSTDVCVRRLCPRGLLATASPVRGCDPPCSPDGGRNGHARRAMATDAVGGAVDRPSPPLLWLGLAGLQMAAWDHVVLPYLIATTT